MPTNHIAAAAPDYVHRDMMFPRELDDQLAQEAARLRVSPVALIWDILTRHFAPATATDEGEKVDEDWFTANGWCIDDRGDGWHLLQDRGVFSLYLDGSWEMMCYTGQGRRAKRWTESLVSIPLPLTDRKILRLLTALGIVPRE